MLELKGSNLGKRQQELNEKVLKTASENVDFNLIKEIKDDTDIDRLYKIDVASVYKNIDYLIQTLKCGDSLYISRALKCVWLFENENSVVINPDYLHHEVFPCMSLKMKRKLLTTISIHIRDEKRAEDFYKYCITDNKLNNIATKFLIWTSEQLKLEYISSNKQIDDDNLKGIIGNSFNLAEAYLAKQTSENRNTNQSVHNLHYLFNISNQKYLDLMEKYTDTTYSYIHGVPRFGLRFSKNVVIKYKERISNNVKLYFEKLNLDMIVKHSSIEDIKEYAIALLPLTAQEFWSNNFYGSYKKIFNILPKNEVIMFLRKNFLLKYPNEPFEMSEDFYTLHYYELFTNEEKETWALEHLKQNNEFLGPDNDYLWYQFVNYDLAFKEIKTYIVQCTDQHIRALMINVLIDSVKNEEDLEKLLRYYYERHVNENEDCKVSFIDSVVDKFNIFEFGEKCWDALINIIYSTTIFSAGSYSFATNKYKTFIILYNFIHDTTIPNILEDYVVTMSNAQNITFRKEYLYKKLTNDQIKLVYEKFMQICTNKLKDLDTQIYAEVMDNARNIIDVALLIMKLFEKTLDDYPDIILKYIKLDSAYYEDNTFIVSKKEEITEGTLLRLLKLDSQLLVQKLADQYICLSRVRMNNLLKKIKIYFPTDVAKEWLSCCELLLEKSDYEYSLFKAIIVAIFHIGSDDYKITFVSKYVPEEAKIPHYTIDRKLLSIQEGICRYAHYSRPPIPLECILPYIKGDYVHYCLPMFGSYISNLTLQQCIKFVTSILNTPVSVQKHGLRLAFQCFSIDDLTNLIVSVWKTTKNITLRHTIYKALCEKIKNVDENSQRKLYEVLKILTLDVHEKDTDDLYKLLTNFKLSQFKADFIKIAWNSVTKLSEKKTKNVQRKCDLIRRIESEIDNVDKEFCRTEIIDEFVRKMLTEQNIGQLYQNNNVKSLIEAKWNLTAKYIIYNDNMERSLDLVHFILHKCIEMWNYTENGYYTSRKFMFSFIDRILICYCLMNYRANFIPVLEYILKVLNELLPMLQIYLLYIKINLIIILKKAIGSNECFDENIAKSVATNVILFLNNLKVNNRLYSSVYNEIGSLLCNTLETICTHTNLDIIKTLVSSHLIEDQVSEMHLLALIILPRECPEKIENIWLGVIGKILNGDNVELQTYVHEYFVHNNYKELQIEYQVISK